MGQEKGESVCGGGGGGGGGREKMTVNWAVKC